MDICSWPETLRLEMGMSLRPVAIRFFTVHRHIPFYWSPARRFRNNLRMPTSSFSIRRFWREQWRCFSGLRIYC